MGIIILISSSTTKHSLKMKCVLALLMFGAAMAAAESYYGGYGGYGGYRGYRGKRSADSDAEAWGTLGYGYGSGYGLGGYGGYGLGVASYGGYGLGHGIWKRSADADSEAWG